MAQKHGLGRGLGALIKDGIPGPQPATGESKSAPLLVPVDRIQKSPWQPRRRFEKEALADLAQSIRQHGILSPLLVRTVGESFELIAGERRYRAAIEAGLSHVPVTVMKVGDRDAMQLALVENLQREDLNPLEEAEGYALLASRFEMTQEAISERVGKARASVANSLRLLELCEEVKQLLASGDITAGHAKALLALPNAADQVALARRVASEGCSVREVEQAVRKAGRSTRKPRASRDDMPTAHLTNLSDRLHRHFGTSVRLIPSRTLANGKKAKGCIEIDFYSNDELSRILDVLGVEAE